ncbi:MAG: hypothetical protein U1F11_06090 [Steroidobacteraceae bacterium]
MREFIVTGCRGLLLLLLATLTAAACSSQQSTAAVPGTDDGGGGVQQPGGSGADNGGGAADGGGVPRGVPVGAGGGASRGLPRNAIHLMPAVIVDATGFERPVAASTIFIPYGWRTQGGVYWGIEALCTNGYVFNWGAASPDGRIAVALLPQDKWETNNYGAPPSTPGCRNAPITSVRQYLEFVVQRLRPGAQILGFRQREDVLRELGPINNNTPTAIGFMRIWAEAGQMMFGYNDRGVDMRGTVTAAVIFNMSRSNAGMGNMDAISAYALPAWAAFAPNGWYNEGFFEGLRRSIRPDQWWQQRINGHNAAIGKVALEESAKRSQILTQSNEEIARIRQSAWNASQESADRRAQQFGELMRGVQTFDDANAPGGQVQLSANYSSAWRLNDGSYVLTNEAGFDPWRDLHLEGQRLELTQR